MSDFVVRQSLDGASDQTETMTVEIVDSSVNAGTAGSVFDNDRGLLRVSNLVVSEVDAASLIATANGGASFFEDSPVTSSAFDYVTTTSTTSGQTVMNVQVNRMRRLKEAFLVNGEGSVMSVSGTMIRDNNFVVNTTQAWSGISVKGGATAMVSETTISRNSGIMFGILSQASGSSVTVRDSFISDNVGSVRNVVKPMTKMCDPILFRVQVRSSSALSAMLSNATTYQTGPDRISAVVIALSSGTTIVERVEFTGNQDFDVSSYFARTV